jgi:hypothetical protein
MIPPEVVARVKAEADLIQIVGRVVPLNRNKGLCPFHAERSPSFHVHATFYKCFGCGKSGDAISFVQETQGLRFADAVAVLAHELGIPVDHSPQPGTPQPPRPRIIPTRPPPEAWNRLQPRLRRPTFAETSTIAQRRGLSLAALELAIRAEQLFCAEVFDYVAPGADAGQTHPAWIVTDSSRRNAQARRLDGQPWAGIGGKKAKTIAGCEASWPIGCPDLTRQGVALVEGGPDFLAAWHFIWSADALADIRPAAMLGAAQSIPPDALPHFAGKDVWIYPHADANRSGEIAAARWRGELLPVARTVQIVPSGAKDLNDLTPTLGHDE